MQHGAGCGAGAGNIAGVLRDLRRNKDNVQHGAPAEKRFFAAACSPKHCRPIFYDKRPQNSTVFLGIFKNNSHNFVSKITVAFSLQIRYTVWEATPAHLHEGRSEGSDPHLKKMHLTPSRLIAVGFLLVILAGAGLLMLPIASRGNLPGSSTPCSPQQVQPA